MVEPSREVRNIDPIETTDAPFRSLMARALTAKLLRSADEHYYARISTGNRGEIHRIDSAAFGDWLLLERTGKERRSSRSQALVRRVVATLEIEARRQTGHEPVFIRVGSDGVDAAANYYLDLGDSSGSAVKICAGGWRTTGRHAIHFRRPATSLALPAPRRDGSIELLRSYANLSDSHFRRAVVWLASALVPYGPHPILIVRGDEGTAKSTLTRVLTSLIDPTVMPIRGTPENADELIAISLDRWVLAYDDVDVLPDWFARTLYDLVHNPGLSGIAQPDCDATSGKSLGARPVIISGVEHLRERGDLRNVAICVQTLPIPFDGRRAENEFWTSFQADFPRILGGLLNVLAEGLKLAQAERLSA